MAINLERYIFIDQHAHSLLRGYSQLDAIGFRQCFSETRSVSQLDQHLGQSVPYKHVVNELCRWFDLSSEEELLEYRAAQAEDEYLNSLWDEVSIGGLIVDDGFKA